MHRQVALLLAGGLDSLVIASVSGIAMKECTVCNSCYPDNIEFCLEDNSRLIASLSIPSLLAGRYQIQKQIGHGRLGRVYFGLDTEKGGEVSIRILPVTLFS